MALLGVNIDHVATVRQARRTNEPDPVWAATLAELGGADGITIHLREDRRHIQDRDLRVLRETVTVKLNLELAPRRRSWPSLANTSRDQATLVPEKREEVTTEGGLDVVAHRQRVAEAIQQLRDAGIIDQPVSRSRSCDRSTRPPSWGPKRSSCTPANTPWRWAKNKQAAELAKLTAAAKRVRDAGLMLHAGHGLTYRNVKPVAAIPGMSELNIGHSIVARALMVGFEQAVREMKRLVS